jgi:hypothetical protein
MSQQFINIGSAPNDSTGDPLRTAFQKVNSNFTEIYGNIASSNFLFQVNTMSTSQGDMTISPANNGNIFITGVIIASNTIQGSITGSAASATIAGTASYASTSGLATAASTVVQPTQGNITGLGTLTTLTVNGDTKVTSGNLFVTPNYVIGNSYGQPGDVAGKIVWSASYIYVCTQNYTGSNPIWLRANLNSF